MKKIFFFICIFIAAMGVFLVSKNFNQNLPIVAIANYGSHASLEKSILGLKEQIYEDGFIENKNIKYKISSVNFDPFLISEMLAGLTALNPKVIVTFTTPVFQVAKGSIKNIPIVFTVVTNHVEAKLLKEKKAILQDVLIFKIWKASYNL